MCVVPLCTSMKVCYELRGDRKYAYKVTSKREPGKKYPTTVKEYLGVVDPDTGNLIPKKTRSDDVKSTLVDGKFRTKDYGNVILVDKVAKDLGILEDLSRSFGSADKAMTVLAMAQALSPAPFMDTETVVGSTYIRETVGLGGMDLSSQRMSEMTKIIGEAGGRMEDLFTLRAEGSGGMFLYDLTPQSTYSEPEGMAERGRNRAGMFVLMTPSADWETAMRSYDARNNVGTAFDIYKNDLGGHRGRTGGPERARGRSFIRFLAMMVRVRDADDDLEEQYEGPDGGQRHPCDRDVQDHRRRRPEDTHGEDKARQGDHGAFRGRRPGAAPVVRSDMM